MRSPLRERLVMDTSTLSLAGLSLAEKRMLLAELLQERASQSAVVFPLSQGQRGMWFLYQLDRTCAAHNVCYASRIRSRLNLGAFRRAVQALVHRHSSLRTTFEERDGELFQRVHQRPPLAFETIDASSWSEETLRERLEAEASRPFDLERDALLRMHLLVRSPTDSILLVSVHHIIGDFWSLVLLIEEMQTLYPAECLGTPATLPAPAREYRDFVRWQSEMLAGSEGDRLWSYWSRQLDGAPTVLELPSDRPRPPVFSRRGGAMPWRVDPNLVRQLKALSLSEGVTLYSTLLATFQTLLGRYTSQDDFLVGSPFAGRNRAGFESVIGYFINMVPLRADLSGNPSFRVLLRRVAATVLDALAHQDYPFSLIVERMNVERDLSRTPLIQASFTLEKTHRSPELGAWRYFLPTSGAKLSVGGLRVEQYYVEQRNCQFDLEMIIEEGEGALEGMIRYNIDIFEPTTIQRMIGHYLTLLDSVARNPNNRISDLPWVAEDERVKVLHTWNQTRADFPNDLCLQQMFEHQAARTPNAIALSDDQRSLTYTELDALSNRLAHRLRRMGIGRGALVAVCVERSPEMFVGILGTLKTGAAYVPLDPATPPDRFSLVLADTASPVLITQRLLRDRLPRASVPVVCIDDAVPVTGFDDTRPPESRVESSDLAYVIYTSGSTGRPKGVMVEHRAIGNTLSWRQRELPILPSDRVLYNLPFQFDPSVCLIFSTLSSGGRLILASPGEEYDPRRSLERVIRDKVTVLEVTPPILRMLVDLPDLAACRSLRCVCCGGEAMPPDLPSRLLDRLNVDLYNLYGPTEAAVDTTWWTCERGAPRPSVPIGRPISNVRAYVLSSDLQPVPPGIPGELYIGGAGLARGYLNDPVLTSQRFLPDPFSGEAGSRLYRSGDRCRWRADGVLEFLGRLDDQVKVRGFRIELGEIEVALLRHPSVIDATVLALAGEGGDSRLVAYVASADGDPLVPDTLRRHLKQCLPDYMVPSSYVVLSALPRSANGKIDRRALPAPPSERPALTRPFVPPRTPLEEYLVRLWRDVLHLNRVGVEDNFFELGGTSIQGAVLINRLQERLDEQVYVIALFDTPTVAGLTRYLAASCPVAVVRVFGSESLVEDLVSERAETAAEAVRGELARPRDLFLLMQPVGTRPPLFMVHPPGGIVVCYQALAVWLGRDRPFYGIRSRGLHGEPDLPARMEDMAAEYVSALREIQPTGPYHLGGWSVGGLVALEMAQHLADAGQHVDFLALLDSTPPAWPGGPIDEDPSGREYGLDKSFEELAELGPDEQLPYLWQHAWKLGLIGPDVPLQVAQQVLDELKRLFHHHMVLANNYVPRRYPGVITLFRPSDAPFVVKTARDRGWGRLAARVDVQFVPGQHHSMVKEPHVRALAQAIVTRLQKAEQVESNAS
jgi:amino acid adenylation domain-containing protein